MEKEREPISAQPSSQCCLVKQDGISLPLLSGTLAHGGGADLDNRKVGRL